MKEKLLIIVIMFFASTASAQSGRIVSIGYRKKADTTSDTGGPGIMLGGRGKMGISYYKGDAPPKDCIMEWRGANSSNIEIHGDTINAIRNMMLFYEAQSEMLENEISKAYRHYR